MSLEELNADVEAASDAIDDEVTLALDRETKRELSMLVAALDADPSDLVQRGIHVLFRSTVDTAQLDFHLRGEYDVTYDEYLSGMTYDEMTGAANVAPPDDDRRYQF